MRGQNVEHALAVRNATARQDLVTENDFFAIVVQAGPVKKQSLFIRLLNRPSGKAARDFLNIFLRVAAVNAHRVQLHQLARVILVDATVDSRRLVFGCRVRA